MEEGTIDLTIYMKRGEGDYYMRSSVDEIRYALQRTKTDNVHYNDIIQDTPLEVEQTQYAIFLQVEYIAYSSRPIN
mgnify:CR=1 FL=1